MQGHVGLIRSVESVGHPDLTVNGRCAALSTFPSEAPIGCCKAIIIKTEVPRQIPTFNLYSVFASNEGRTKSDKVLKCEIGEWTTWFSKYQVKMQM